MARHVLIVLSNAVDGRDDEFNDWYENVHLPDLLKVDGFCAAQRFKLAEPQIYEDRSYQYLAIYEIDAEDIEKALAALSASSGDMEISPALAEGAKPLAFSAIGERQTAG